MCVYRFQLYYHDICHGVANKKTEKVALLHLMPEYTETISALLCRASYVPSVL